MKTKATVTMGDYSFELPIACGSLGTEALRNYIERIERLLEEKKGLGSDITDIYKEAEEKGYDKKAMREIIKLRAMEREARKELEDAVDVYKLALGLED